MCFFLSFSMTQNLRTLHKHNEKTMKECRETWRSPACLRALDLCLLFRYRLVFLLCFANRKKKSFRPARIFLRVSRRQSARCYVIPSLIRVHRCVVQGISRNVIDFYFFRDYDNRHGDGHHYWLLFISHFHFLGTNLFSTQALRKLPEDPSKAT